MLLALASIVAQYGGGGGSPGSGGDGYSAGYWVIVGLVAVVVIGVIAWLVGRARARRGAGSPAGSRSGKIDRAA